MFAYTNATGREYDDAVQNVRTVLLPVSRRRMAHVAINFEPPASERRAVEAAEEYLSQPLTEGYFEAVKHDLPARLTWAEAKEAYPCRGGCLGTLTRLEKIVGLAPGLIWLSPVP